MMQDLNKLNITSIRKAACMWSSQGDRDDKIRKKAAGLFNHSSNVHESVYVIDRDKGKANFIRSIAKFLSGEMGGKN